MINLDKINATLGSTKSIIIQAAAFIGIATAILYLLHIEHLPKLSLFESITAIASFGAISAIILAFSALLTTFPSLILMALNMEIKTKIGMARIRDSQWITIIILETAIIFFGYLFAFGYVAKPILLWAFFPGAIFSGLLYRITKSYFVGPQTLFYALLVFVASAIHPLLYGIITKHKFEDKVILECALGIILPAVLMISSPFFKGKLGTWILAISVLVTPYAFTLKLGKPSLIPRFAMQITRQGNFFAEKVVLNKKGCQLVSDTPNSECVTDVYYVCSAYVASRLGDPNLIRFFRKTGGDTASSKTYEIPPTSILGLTMSKEQPLLDEAAIDKHLEKIAENCQFPAHLVIDGLFSFKESDLSKNSRRRLAEEAGKLLTSGIKPPIRILGYADESGSKAENLALSAERAAKVRDYLITQGYPGSLIKTNAEGAINPLIQCKHTTAQGKYDCGRINRRVEIYIDSP